MPMLDYIQYDHKFDAVFRAIFANSVFVRDIAAGQRVSKNDRFDCVTLEGIDISFYIYRIFSHTVRLFYR